MACRVRRLGSRTYKGRFSRNLHATHTNLEKPSGGPYVAVEPRGDGPAVDDLATGTEAVNRRMARRLAD
eukprot:5959779-Prymnesium_polylepis.1